MKLKDFKRIEGLLQSFDSNIFNNKEFDGAINATLALYEANYLQSVDRPDIKQATYTWPVVLTNFKSLDPDLHYCKLNWTTGGIRLITCHNRSCYTCQFDLQLTQPSDTLSNCLNFDYQLKLVDPLMFEKSYDDVRFMIHATISGKLYYLIVTKQQLLDHYEKYNNVITFAFSKLKIRTIIF